MPAETITILLSARNLQKWFPIRRSVLHFVAGRPPRYVKAVDGIDFEIATGETLVLVGESGCGKTTTAKLLMRAEQPDRGTIRFNGNDIAEFSKREISSFKRRVQMIFQDPYASLNPRMKVRDIILEPLIVHKLPLDPKERMAMVIEALEDVRLSPPDDFVNRYPHMLSGGQRQRVAIARAKILNPSLIIADEPVSMLDLSIRAEILELMKRLQTRYGLAYLYITHDLSTARYVADRIAVMYLGKIVEVAPSEKLLSNPLHPYTQALIDAVTEPDPSNRFREKKVRAIGDIQTGSETPRGCRFHPRCPHAMDICREKEPPLEEIDLGHFAACYLHTKS